MGRGLKGATGACCRVSGRSGKAVTGTRTLMVMAAAYLGDWAGWCRCGCGGV